MLYLHNYFFYYKKQFARDWFNSLPELNGRHQSCVDAECEQIGRKQWTKLRCTNLHDRLAFV